MDYFGELHQNLTEPSTCKFKLGFSHSANTKKNMSMTFGTFLDAESCFLFIFCSLLKSDLCLA